MRNKRSILPGILALACLMTGCGGEQKGGELTLEQANPTTQSVVANLNCPYQIFSSEADHKEIMEAYEQAVLQGQEEGFTPVLVRADDVLDEHLGMVMEEGYSVEEVLKAEPESGQQWLEETFQLFWNGIDGFDMDAFVGHYQGKATVVDSYSALQGYFSLMENTETILLKVPTTKPWEVVAYVPFGGWNECPEAEKMMAVCKHWYEKYGAVPVTISHDVMEMRVPAPVAGQDAIQVAKEHFAFDPDRVLQGTETATLSELADCLAVSKIWFFWWD